MDIIVKMKDGSHKAYTDTSEYGATYVQTMRSEVGFIVITNASGASVWLPTQNILEINQSSTRP